jgi:transcriptional regulator with XRE-family HTH domain
MMQGKREKIAARVREARECSEFTAEDLASRVDLSPGEYLKMEAGEIDFPASLLHEIARYLNTCLVALLTGRDVNMRQYAGGERRRSQAPRRLRLSEFGGEFPR